MDQKIIEIFKNDLKSDKGSELEIESLTSAREKRKTDYKPYYQRNYVWQDDKASYLLESILLGYQIPPIIFFSRTKDGKKISEIIDGRQRYQTILRYVDNEFTLDKKGLQSYENLDKKKFNDLENEIQERLLESTVTKVNYSLSSNVEQKYEDYVIKEIFRRYNSGITKMKTIDNERAEYINDNLNGFFEKYVENNMSDYQNKYVKLFFAQKKQLDLGNSDTNKSRDAIEELKRIFRKLYVIHLCPVKKSLGTGSLLKNIFDSLDTNNEDELSNQINNFDMKIKIIFNTIETLFSKDYFYKINKELTTVFYWSLSILEQEKVSLSLIEKYKELILSKIMNDDNYLNFQLADIDYQYKPYKFELFIEVINEILQKEDISLVNDLSKVYIHNKNFKFEKELHTKEDLEEPIRVHTKEINIETFLKQIKRGKFIIRPQYQRNEVINNTKSSGIIESLLLDIKLPPIFVYERLDGVSEVIDGQQRLLSILGYLNEKYMNESGVLEDTKKPNFKLSGLKILGSELNNKKFEDLSEEQQDILWDSSLSIIRISEEDNSEFDPISLFLRLNLKPYPIDENSFEMWNSYLDKDLTDLIKINLDEKKESNFTEISKWAYFKKNAKRMEDEEIYTILAHIDYQVSTKKVDLLDILDIHMKNDKIIVRLHFALNKQATTKSLRDNINLNEEERNKFIISLKNIKKMFEKIESLLLVLDNKEENLRKSFDILVGNKGLARKKYTFYLLYVLLSQIPKAMIIENREKEMLQELREFFVIINDDSMIVYDDEFKYKIENFIKKYTPSKRIIKLNEEEIESLRLKNNNTCPICKNSIFESDEIHIDHIKPISKGGKDTIENMQITHSTCNLSKGNRD